MSLVKGKQEFRTILDFSYKKISKTRIAQALRDVEVLELIHSQESNTYTFIENEIIVGMYQIRLFFNKKELDQNRTRLKEYGGFGVAIYERKHSALQNINLQRDKRFNNQAWVELNGQHKIRAKTLVDIILHLRRLNYLKMFL
jgi:hypothetical protein